MFTELVWDHLLSLIAEGRVIPIIGQDLLVIELENRSLTLYELLAERLAVRLLATGGGSEPAKARSLNMVAYDFLSNKGEIQYLYSALKMVAPDLAQLPIPQPLLQLASITSFKLFVTTTFDGLLERALLAMRGPQSVQQVLSFFPQDACQDLSPDWKLHTSATIYQLLGKLSAAPVYAVTEEDTLEFVHALQSQERRPKELFNALMEHDLLILGNSFPDWLARFFIRVGRGERLSASSRSKTEFLADGVIQKDPGLVLFLQHFSSHTKIFLDGGPVQFVNELHQRWRNRQELPREDVTETSTLSLSREASAEHVFISYPRESKAAALELKTALELDKIPVWFDEKDIGWGDSFASVIRRAIENAVLFVPIISKITRAGVFRSEWEYAIEWSSRFPKNRPFILPLAIDDTPENDETLPERFRELNWTRVEGRPISEVVAEIRTLFRKAQQIGVS
jgi:hypothetical protein